MSSEYLHTLQEQLDQKRAELSAAEQQLGEARSARNTDAVIKAQERVEVIKDLLCELEVDYELAAAAQAKEDALARLLGIRKAVGSVAHTMREDVAKIVELNAQIIQAINTLNERYAQVTSYDQEYEALKDRFEFTKAEAPRLELPTPPAVTLDKLTASPVPFGLRNRMHPDLEQHEYFEFRRRTYAEVEGTPAGEIIARAGLKAWPRLTATQQARMDALLERQGRESRALDVAPLAGHQ
jgi:hypothetical protein